MRIALFSHSEKDFLQCKSNLAAKGIDANIIHRCDSSTTSRLSYLTNNANTWVLFLDSDCEMNLSTFENICSYATDKSVIYAGIYENPQTATYLQKAHNFTANTWLYSSMQSENRCGYFLGGAFLIFSDVDRVSAISADDDLFWGAEDKKFSLQLAKVGYEIKIIPAFKVIHNTSKSLVHFVRRSFLQGYNDDLRSPKTKGLSYWLSELALINLWLLPAVLLHFSVLKLGKLFQILRPRRSKKTSK